MLHLFGVQTYTPPTTEKLNIRALRSDTGCHKMSSIDHLHKEAEMLKVMEHSELLSAQYLDRCLESGKAYHSITTRATPKKQMKETLYTRHRNTVEPMMVEKYRKATLQALHTNTVNKAVKSQKECGARWSSSANKKFRKIPNQESTLNPRSTKIRIWWTPGFLQDHN